MRFPDLPTDRDIEEDEIAFHYEDVPSPFADELPYCQWLANVADEEERPLLSLTYIFCSDAYLLRVNTEYLQHDFYTDVITFPYAEPEEGVHGDVFISTERVAENARDLGVPFERELARVMVHGLLHLAGYSDKTEDEQGRMREKEDHYLALLNVG